MRKILISFTCLCLFAVVAMAQDHTPAKSNSLLRHVVMFKFSDKATAADTRKIEEAFRALPGKISLIKDFEWGVNNSPEKLNQGLTHCFFLSFTSAKDRDAYLVHPDHKLFTTLAGPSIDKVTVLDYWVHK